MRNFYSNDLKAEKTNKMIDRLSAFTQTGINRPAGRPGKSSAGSSLWFTPLPTTNNNHAILACSAADVSREHRELFGMRRLGEDRRGFFDHFKPTTFVKGVSLWFVLLDFVHVFLWEDPAHFSLGLVLLPFVGGARGDDTGKYHLFQLSQRSAP